MESYSHLILLSNEICTEVSCTKWLIVIFNMYEETRATSAMHYSKNKIVKIVSFDTRSNLEVIFKITQIISAPFLHMTVSCIVISTLNLMVILRHYMRERYQVGETKYFQRLNYATKVNIY